MGRTVIIAEIGECFNGNLKTARRLISEAKKAGCDIAKFQTLDCEGISEDDPEKEWFKKIALNPEKIEYLIGCGNDTGIPVLFTPENVKTCRWLLDAHLKDVKIASSCITNIELIDFVSRRFKRVFLSTGMATLGEVKRAARHLSKVKDLYIMHCISEYPTGPLLEKRGLTSLSNEDVRLNMMRMLKQIFPKRKIGYSDHTSGVLAPVVAVAMGAAVIEKHITLDRKTPVENFKRGKKYLGTDHVLAIEPHELKEMVSRIREAEKMAGEWKWERSSGEKMLRDFAHGRFAGG